MGDITIGQMSETIAIIVAILGGVGVIIQAIRTAIKKGLQSEFDGINQRLDSFEAKIDEADLNACKNFLVSCLADIEDGKQFDSIKEERFWEQYQHYTNRGGNSYIKHRVEQLKNEGKL